MKPAMFLALVALSVASAGASTVASGVAAEADPVSSFLKEFNRQADTFAEYRFLASTAAGENDDVRNLSAQLLATNLSVLGRPRDALTAFPLRASSRSRNPLPTRAAYKAVAAADWITRQSGAYRVVMLNEAHHAPQTRVLTFELLRRLRARGFAYLALEALANDGSDPMPDGYPTRKTGIYTREPLFAELLREARRLGYILVPYEPAETGEHEASQQQRETGQAQALARLLAAHPDARVLVHAGYAHIGERQSGLPENARPMAMELARISGLPILTVEQTTTASYEAGDIDTVGHRLARRFGVRTPSILVDRKTGRAWARTPGLNDASVLLPPSPPVLRPDWLSIGGRRHPVAIDLAPCLGHLPCVAEATHADEGGDAIAADQFLMLSGGEAGTPLFLAPGRYRLRIRGREGTTLAERELDVPSGH